MFRSSARLVSMFFALVVLLLAGPSLATPCGEWQGPKPTGDNVKNRRTGTTYATLGDAVTAANAGDTLQVLVPNLPVGAIKIDKNLTLTSSAASTLTAAIDTCGQGDARGWFLVSSGVDLTVSDLSFDGAGKQIYEAFRHQGTGSFNSVTFKGIAYQATGPDYQGTGIAVFGSGASVDVTNCTFFKMGRAGVLYYGSGVTGTVKGLNYTGKGQGNWLDYGVDVEAGAVVTVQNSSVSQCLGAADGSVSAGVQISTFQGSGTNATLTNNSITNNTIGIAAGYGGGNNPDTSLVVAHANTITGNKSGLDAETDKPINATGNHWGCTQGPGHPGCDPVTGPYAYQVNTGYGTKVTWSFNESNLAWGWMQGESVLAIATFSPALSEGTMVQFTATGATLSGDAIPIAGGKAVTTVTAGDVWNVGLSLTAGTVKSSHDASTRSPENLIAEIKNLTMGAGGKGSIEAYNLGGGNTGYLFGGTALGYTEEPRVGCAVGIADAKALGSALATGYASEGAKIEFTLPSAWQGQTVYLQLVSSGGVCQVTKVHTVSN